MVVRRPSYAPWSLALALRLRQAQSDAQQSFELIGGDCWIDVIGQTLMGYYRICLTIFGNIADISKAPASAQ